MFVTMTDRFMSRWGKALDRINKVVFECEDEEEAAIVAANAEDHRSMIDIQIVETVNVFDERDYLVTNYDKTNAGRWYRKGAFL